MKSWVIVGFFLLSSHAFAYGYGSGAQTWSLGLLGGLVAVNEADMNSLISRANTRVGGISTSQLGNAYEFGGFIQRRLNQSALALQLRPLYFMDSTSGTGGSGTYKYSLSGISMMPLLKAYVLESQSVHLYVQGGIGWGNMWGTIQEASAEVDFNSNAFGFQGGIGVDFCLGMRNQHCFIAEGNYRYLSFDRNIASNTSGSFASGSVSQATNGLEVEIDGHDLATTMSGVQGLIGYQYNLD